MIKQTIRNGKKNRNKLEEEKRKRQIDQVTNTTGVFPKHSCLRNWACVALHWKQMRMEHLLVPLYGAQPPSPIIKQQILIHENSYAVARDWARFGLLYLQDGIWNGERILPEQWVSYTATAAPHSNKLYGAHWWRNSLAGLSEKEKSMAASNNLFGWHKELPDDAFYAHGFEEQVVMVIPSKKLVVVRLGMTKVEGAWNAAKFWQGILASLP
jgi:CubicO group peptidase (beta-lactamase class C family)